MASADAENGSRPRTLDLRVDVHAKPKKRENARQDEEEEEALNKQPEVRVICTNKICQKLMCKISFQDMSRQAGARADDIVIHVDESPVQSGKMNKTGARPKHQAQYTMVNPEEQSLVG